MSLLRLNQGLRLGPAAFKSSFIVVVDFSITRGLLDPVVTSGWGRQPALPNLPVAGFSCPAIEILMAGFWQVFDF